MVMGLSGLTYQGSDAYNMAPTETVEVLRRDSQGALELVPMRWWLTPSWAKTRTTKYAMFNARCETAAGSPAFKLPYRTQRCVVPISGFYEWCKINSQKLPFLIRPEFDSGMLLAGLWDSWRDPRLQLEQLSFTILTTSAHAQMAHIHGRQPVMLSPDSACAWLDTSQPTDCLTTLFDSVIPVSLQVVPVASYVNNTNHADQRCVEAVGPAVSVSPSNVSADPSVG